MVEIIVNYIKYVYSTKFIACPRHYLSHVYVVAMANVSLSAHSIIMIYMVTNICLSQLIMPGYCVAGTVGHKVLSGAKKIEIDKKMVNVRLSVQYMSFR